MTRARFRLLEARTLLRGLWLLAALWFAGNVGVAHADYTWNLPPNFPVPRVPEDNPMSRVKVELGRFVFYDTRM